MQSSIIWKLHPRKNAQNRTNGNLGSIIGLFKVPSPLSPSLKDKIFLLVGALSPERKTDTVRSQGAEEEGDYIYKKYA